MGWRLPFCWAATCVRYARTRGPRRTHEERDPRHPTYELPSATSPVAPCHQETVEIYNPTACQPTSQTTEKTFDGR